MLLHGEGFNGKSILFNLIERFLGKENVSGLTLRRLINEDRFDVAGLYNKMANVDADISVDLVSSNTGTIKKLTGNDLHWAEKKYVNAWPFRNHAKLFFSCNRLPENYDDTDAFYRRIIIIAFTHQFLGEKDDPHIIDKLCMRKNFPTY